MTFSENQVRHLYVVEDANKVEVVKDLEGKLYLKLVNALGEPIRTDAIENIMYAKATPAYKMQREVNAVTVELDGAPVVGENYTIVITYRGFVGISDEEFYHEFADFRATTTVASDLYKGLALQLAKNTAKQGLVKVELATSSSAVLVTSKTKANTLNGAYTGIIITEIEQPWTLGIKPQTVVALDANAVKLGTVKVNGIEKVWGTVELTEGDVKIGNGKTTADLEYFSMGERGDLYRNVGWPNSIKTTYMVDATKEYDYIDIHYAYQGTCEDIQKSEKDLTIVCAAGADGKTHTLANAVIAKINAVVTGLITTIAPDPVQSDSSDSPHS